ncbi:MAG: mevalonate kinase [Spirochaetota bacterium]
MAYIGRAWGKLLLFGEHAAVYGYPAVGLALPETMEVEITPEGTPPEPGTMLFRPDMPPFSSMVRALETLFPPVSAGGILDRLRGGVRIMSSIPQSLGYGSSAALCSAFSRAALNILADVGIVATEQDVWRIANSLERVFHGTPSGVDTGLATLGGIQAFYVGTSDLHSGLPSATPLPSFPFAMVTGAVPREASTKDLVGALRNRIEAGDSEVQRRLESLGRTAERGIEVIRDPEADHAGEIGRLATEAHAGLKSLGLSTDPLEIALDTGMDAGATGGKLSGAGGGGAFYLMFRTTEEARTAYGALRKSFRRYPESAQWPLRVFEAKNGTVCRVAA